MKKIISALLFTALIFTSALGADGISYDGKKAEVLSQLNILKGDEDGFRLDSYPTRIEAVIIMLRLTGSEQTALEKNLHHPFSDVPDWAGAYAGYAYASSITSGVSENEFGTDEPLTADQFAAFALRALGYDDANGDFDVDSALKFAYDKKIISAKVNEKDFKGRDTVSILYDILGAKLKNSDTTLAEKLKTLFETDKDKLSKYAKILYAEACLISGKSIENPAEFSELVCELM